MNEVLGQHDLLLESSNRKEAELHAHFFCEHNDLVRYDSITHVPPPTKAFSSFSRHQFSRANLLLTNSMHSDTVSAHQ